MKTPSLSAVVPIVQRLSVAGVVCLAVSAGPREAEAAVVLNELLASNRTTIRDDEGRASDWLELHNTGSGPVALEGYGLSDDPKEPGKWSFPPDTNLPAGGYLFVWCSGDDRGALTPAVVLHTNFQLSARGETIALTDPSGTVISRLTYPRQIEDQSFGLSPNGTGTPLYHVTPTPGAPNAGPTATQPRFVADTRFSVDRGFYDAPFELEITTGTTGAQIHYTTNGSDPTVESARYGAPITIADTTTIRARAFLDGHKPTNTDTHTYIFIQTKTGGILRQPQQPDGFPGSWGPRASDYAMDPRVATDVESAFYEPAVAEALLDLPSLSLVLDLDDLFDAERGIYANPGEEGVLWERPTSLELIYPDERRGFQIDAGLRMQGGASRSLNRPKHNMRVLFKSIYGPAKLRHPLFKDSAVHQFDTIILRGGNGDSWFHPSANQQRDAQYIRDQWARDVQQGMGRLTTHQAYMHLYLNGLYWGVYHIFERPSAPFLADHQGGAKEEYDALNLGVPVDGNLEAWDTMMGLANEMRETPERYKDVLEYLDAPNLIDFLLINFYSGNTDWDHNNWYAGRRRTPAAGYRFFVWDSERTFLSVRENTTVTNNTNRPTGLHNRLLSHEDYQVLFADHVQRHFFGDGLLTPDQVSAVWLARAEEIERPLRAESARWGDNKRPVRPYTVDAEWRDHLQELRETYFPARTDIVLDQLRGRRLLPSLEAPKLGDGALGLGGGRVAAGFRVAVDAMEGAVYVTLDGADPRLPGGEPSPNALRLEPRAPQLLVASGADVRVLVPSDGALGLDWTTTEFDDTDWIAGTTGVGYQRSENVLGFAENIGTPVEELLYQISPSIYLRIEFDVADPAAFDLLELHLLYDDGFVAYLNGERVASRLAPEAPQWDDTATSRRSNLAAVEFERIAIGTASPLQSGRNVLALHGLNFIPNDRDLLLLPELSGITLAETSIEVTETVHIKARAHSRQSWSPVQEATFLVEPYPLRITEIHYHPPAPSDDDSPFEADDFEFLELKNVGTASIALDGVRVAGAVDQDLPPRAMEPGAFLLLARNEKALRSRHTIPDGVPVIPYEEQLRNSEDTVRLVAPDGTEILAASYSDAWYPATDGFAFSLVLADEQAPPSDLGAPRTWKPSHLPGGSPGADERPLAPGGRRLRGDSTQDGRLNLLDAVTLLRGIFDKNVLLPCEGETVDDRGTVQLLDIDVDGRLTTLDGLALLRHIFGQRTAATLGHGCSVVTGCSENCGD